MMLDPVKIIEKATDKRLIAAIVVGVLLGTLLVAMAAFLRISGDQASGPFQPALLGILGLLLCLFVYLILLYSYDRPSMPDADPLVGQWHWRHRYPQLDKACMLIDALHACRESGQALEEIVDASSPVRNAWKEHSGLLVAAIVWQLKNLDHQGELADLLSSLNQGRNAWPFKQARVEIAAAIGLCEARFRALDDRLKSEIYSARQLLPTSAPGADARAGGSEGNGGSTGSAGSADGGKVS